MSENKAQSGKVTISVEMNEGVYEKFKTIAAELQKPEDHCSSYAMRLFNEVYGQYLEAKKENPGCDVDIKYTFTVKRPDDDGLRKCAVLIY